MSDKISIFWFRRDLRLEDNTALGESLSGKYPVLPIFIFDQEILEDLPMDDARVTFIFETIQKLRSTLQEKHNSSLALFYGKPDLIFKKIISQYKIQEVFTNHDYEPYARKRDKDIAGLLLKQNIPLNTFKDQVIFEKNEITKVDGQPYIVYTPYKNKWKEKFYESEVTSLIPISLALFIKLKLDSSVFINRGL